ncbi:transcriptional regulator [Escherichia coli]|nr:transcriptional regulator [Escherichia coli]
MFILWYSASSTFGRIQHRDGRKSATKKTAVRWWKPHLAN